MYCRKCGKEMGENDAFCPQCGEGVENRKVFPVATVRDGFRAIRLPESFSDRMYRLGEIKVYFFVALLAQLACVFLVGMEMISFEVSAWYWDESMSISIFEDKKLILFLFRAGYFAAAVMMLLPLFSNEDWKSYDFFLGRGMPIAGLIWFAIVLLRGGEMLPDSSEYYDIVDVTINLEAAAWIFLGLSVVALLLTHKVWKEIGVMQYASQRKRDYEKAAQRDNCM